MLYIPQLVQALRYDSVNLCHKTFIKNNVSNVCLCLYTHQMGYISEFIKSMAERSQLVTHQLLWNMNTNMFKDDDSQSRDGEVSRPNL